MTPTNLQSAPFLFVNLNNNTFFKNLSHSTKTPLSQKKLKNLKGTKQCQTSAKLNKQLTTHLAFLALNTHYYET